MDGINQSGAKDSREDAVRDLLTLCATQGLSIPPALRLALNADDEASAPVGAKDSSDPFPSPNTSPSRGEGVQHYSSFSPSKVDTDKLSPLISSSFRLRNQNIRQSSRSVRYLDTREIDEKPKVNLTGNGHGRPAHQRSNSAPPEAFVHYCSSRRLAADADEVIKRNLTDSCDPGIKNVSKATAEEKAWDGTVSRDFLHADESHPLLSGTKLYCNAEEPGSTIGPAIRKSVGGGILRHKGNHCVSFEGRRRQEKRLYRIAAAFLMDFETSRPPTLPPDSDFVSSGHLSVHWWRFSILWRCVMGAATLCLFLASCFEGGDWEDGWESFDDDLLVLRRRRRELALLVLTFVPVVVYTADVLMMRYLFGRKASEQLVSTPGQDNSSRSRLSTVETLDSDGNTRDLFSDEPSAAPLKARKSRSRWWAVPLTVFLAALSLETLVLVATQRVLRKRVWTSAFKPIVLFYASPKARNALDAMNRVSRTVFRVLFIELFLIFTFAAVACQLYSETFRSFQGLSNSFLSMFQLSTTVVNPSLWMPVYNENRSAAFFFVCFLVISVFYMHSLVLSVVFQSYMEGLMIIRQHASNDKEETLKLCFRTLRRIKRDRDAKGELDSVVVSTESVGKLLMVMRPHYDLVKINALVDIVDPTNAGDIDYNSFRTRMPKALNTSVRSSRHHSAISVGLGIFAAFVAVANVVYVVFASSTYNSVWWSGKAVFVGCFITILGVVELVARFIVHMHRLAAVAKPNVTFDGLAVAAAAVSAVGFILHHFGYRRSLDWLITGRAIDMIRCLRFSSEFRRIVYRSGEVVPALVGPLVLLITALHMFTYLGMALWGGAIEVGSNSNLTPFYDLNNFNEYTSGLITMFQVLVVNDWHAIAEVFILPSNYATTNAMVYPFFISGNLFCVSVLLNVLTAFFVGAFVTKVTDRRDERISTSDGGVIRVPLMSSSIRNVRFEEGLSSDEESASSTKSLTVSERHGFDNIMRTVAGEEEDEDDAAKECCHLLELFESLSPSRENVGYLVSCQRSMSRYGNQRFQTMVHQYMDDQNMHTVISEMQTELANMPDGDEVSLHRRFPPLKDQSTVAPLEITASLLKERWHVSLFVSKICETCTAA